jgi:hypothetical protein
MTYKIAGVTLDPQPTTGRWIPRSVLNVDGNGRPIYEPTRRYELTWGLLDPEEYDDLQDHYLSIGATGSLVVDLPLYTTGSYVFQSYTGCYVYEPKPGRFFVENYMDVTLLITNIVTEK